MVKRSMQIDSKDQWNTLLNKNEIHMALTLYNHAIESDPENGNAYFNRANFYAELSKSSPKYYPQAMLDYHAAIHLDPKNIEFIYARGVTLIAHNKFDEAMEDFDNVIELNPEFHLAYYQLGIILNQLAMRECNMELGKVAIRYFQKAAGLGNEKAVKTLNKI